MLFYRAAVDLPRSTLNYVAGLIRRRRKAIGSPWRLLNPGWQALLVLVYSSAPIECGPAALTALPSTAARIRGITHALDAHGIPTPVDKAYQGAGARTVITPYKGKERNKFEQQK